MFRSEKPELFDFIYQYLQINFPCNLPSRHFQPFSFLHKEENGATLIKTFARGRPSVICALDVSLQIAEYAFLDHVNDIRRTVPRSISVSACGDNQKEAEHPSQQVQDRSSRWQRLT